MKHPPIVVVYRLEKGVPFQAGLAPEPDETVILIELVFLVRQITLEVDIDDFQELLDRHNQESIIDQLIEMHKQDLPAAIEEVEIEVVSPSIVPSGKFAELKLYCHLYGAQGQRQAYLLPMP
ncbi:hypothetical protein TNCV_3334121 [Trichonephila clavipes]|nr:hypothetical protein TNCV_3334121 [Trichonephila clavipes]